MNHARWSIDFINRQKHRQPSKEKKLTSDKSHTILKPKSIIDLVLEERKSKP